MMYYQMIDTEMRGRWHLKGLTDANGARLDPREFCNGQIISETPEMRLRSDRGEFLRVSLPLTLGMRNDGVQLDFTYGPFQIPVVTPNVIQLLRSAGVEGFQTFPARVEGVGREFSILNITERRECIDRERSRVQWWEQSDARPDKLGKPRAIYELVVARERVEGCHLFRLEGWEIAVIVSSKVKDLFDANSVSGTEFIGV